MTVYDQQKITIGSIYIEDIELGAVELKDGGSDNRAAITAGGVLSTQVSGGVISVVSGVPTFIPSGNNIIGSAVVYNTSPLNVLLSGVQTIIPSGNNVIGSAVVFNTSPLNVLLSGVQTVIPSGNNTIGSVNASCVLRDNNGGTIAFTGSPNYALPVDVSITDIVAAYVPSGNMFIQSGNTYNVSGNMYLVSGTVSISGIPPVIGSVAVTNFGGVLGSVQIAGGYTTGSVEVTNTNLNVITSGISPVIGSFAVSNFGGVLGSVQIAGGYSTGSVTVTNTNLDVITSGISPIIGSVAVTNTVPTTPLGSVAITNFGGVLGSVCVTNTNVSVITSGISPVIGSFAVSNFGGVLGSVTVGAAPAVAFATDSITIGSCTPYLNVIASGIPSIIGSVALTNTNVNVITSGISPVIGSFAVSNFGGVLGSVCVTNTNVSVITSGISPVVISPSSTATVSGIWVGSPANAIIGINASRKIITLVNATSGTVDALIMPVAGTIGLPLAQYGVWENTTYTGSVFGYTSDGGSRLINYWEN